MKSQFQTLTFLSQYTPKSDLDKEFINSFLVQRFQITPKTPVFAPESQSNLIDVQSFISWFKTGLEALKIARYKNKTVLLGRTTLDKAEIIAELDEVNFIKSVTLEVDSQCIEDATEDQATSFRATLLANNLQPDPNTLRLVPKYTPKMSDRVVFYDYAQDIQGVGVVRDIDAEGNVIFFCYFTYPTYSQPKLIGYNLHENPGYNLRDFVFENIDKENVMTTLGNSTSCFRRLGRELERVGKVWKDKLLRIEPVKVEQEVGGKYWYISDKMKVVQETEKGTPTCHLRYLAGNYFTSHIAATKMLGKINELFREYLASENWPEVE